VYGDHGIDTIFICAKIGKFEVRDVNVGVVLEEGEGLAWCDCHIFYSGGAAGSLLQR
jgi:hypothetical protein